MHFKLNLSRPDGSHADLQVTVDADCTIGHLADRLAQSDPVAPTATGSTLVLAGPQSSIVLDRRVPVVESGLHSGASIALGAAPRDHAGGVAATLQVVGGPDIGRHFDLQPGSNTVGRGRQCAVQLADPMVSTLHARVIVSGDTVEVVDENSSNGIVMGGEQVSRVVLAHGDQIVLGEDVITVTARRHGDSTVGLIGSGEASVEFNRSPRVDPTYEGVELIAPEPPGPAKQQRFPVASLVAPLVMGAILVLALENWQVALFICLSPFVMLGGWYETRRANRREHEESVAAFHGNLAELLSKATSAQDEERARRLVEHPGTADVVGAIAERSPLLWTRRPEHSSFMELRLGLGAQDSRVRFNRIATRSSLPELTAELDAVVDRFHAVDRVPVVASFDTAGSIGVSGSGEGALAVARGVLLQLVGMHSPAELVLCSLASASSAPQWEWIKWLPHTSSEQSPLASSQLAASPPTCSNLVAELTDLITERHDVSAAGEGGPRDFPRIVVLVLDDAPVERNRLVSLAESGPAVGVHLLWLAQRTAELPAACRSFLEVDEGGASTGRVVEAELTKPVLVEPVSASDAAALARSLSPVVDAGALADDQSDLPRSVSFLADAGLELAERPDAVLDRWRESQSVFPPSEFPPAAPRPLSRRTHTLRALVGRGKGDNLYLDLRAHGPHALVGGTTGAGKSEFLQSWIMGMASAHGPQRVTFLFIDYKGGAAFAECIELPHCVGLVTDLSPHLVRRALTSLRAELHHRERLLNRHGAKDLAEMESAGHPDTPPSLVIVVDEFAALVQEVPEFVDGVVDVAQRGRSLGLHLILATQRPAGVIKDNLRANTNLRIALRMADDDDSRDVIGTTEAASFDPSLPGRAVAKTGPGRLTSFQAGYLGGWTRREAPLPSIDVVPFGFGAGAEWQLPESALKIDHGDRGPSDITRLATQIAAAAKSVALPEPRRPWLPDLNSLYELGSLTMARRDDTLAFGVIDDPAHQEQRVVSFLPDRDGNMAVYGTGGTGKSTFLRTLAVSAGLTVRGGPCVVYGLDFGSRGLTMLDALPHVGSIIGGDDHERVARLIRQLRETVDERGVRYAAVQAGSIGEYRSAAGEPDEPRILVLVDGMGAFRNAYESSEYTHLFEMFQSVASDGRQVGVHVVVSADRVGAVPAALGSSIQRSLVLRLASENDLMTLGVPADGFGPNSPPGRGFMDDAEIQVAVLGGSRNVADQAAAIERLGTRLLKEGAVGAPEIRRLPEYIELRSLTALAESTTLPVFGLDDEALGPVGFDPSLPILVAGPAGSGRTTAVETLVTALWRECPAARPILLGPRRSGLAGLGLWHRAAVGVDAVAALAAELVEQLEADHLDDSHVLVIEGIGEFLNTPADYVLADVVKLARSNGLTVIAEGETSTLGGSWPLLSGVKGARQGLILQPDQMDGDSLFQTSLGRVKRADFPPGRGMYVRAGRAARVQVARA